MTEIWTSDGWTLASCHTQPLPLSDQGVIATERRAVFASAEHRRSIVPHPNVMWCRKYLGNIGAPLRLFYRLFGHFKFGGVSHFINCSSAPVECSTCLNLWWERRTADNYSQRGSCLIHPYRGTPVTPAGTNENAPRRADNSWHHHIGCKKVSALSAGYKRSVRIFETITRYKFVLNWYRNIRYP